MMGEAITLINSADSEAKKSDHVIDGIFFFLVMYCSWNSFDLNHYNYLIKVQLEKKVIIRIIVNLFLMLSGQ